MAAPRLLQSSFARGEITPLLYARVDLNAYQSGLSKLQNMIVMGTGGATRRPGFRLAGRPWALSGTACPVRLIPFVYNRSDSMMLEFTSGSLAVWRPANGERRVVASHPYSTNELRELSYTQSGNVIFLAHRNHPVYMVRRNAMWEWTCEQLDLRNGPWLVSGIKGTENTSFRVEHIPLFRLRVIASDDFFEKVNVLNKLIELNYAIPSRTIEAESTQGTDDPDADDYYISEAIEVGGQWNFQTFGSWRGWIVVQRSYDNELTWVDVFAPKKRDNPDEQGNYDLSEAEDEANVKYRVKVKHLAGSSPMRFSFTAAGYTKTNIFKFVARSQASNIMYADWLPGKHEVQSTPIYNRDTLDWRLGAWGGDDGYPGVVDFYQGRLCLGGSVGEPLNVWMSRSNDFADFGTSPELQDDDAVNITLSSGDADGIQALVGLDDLLVLTASGEWRVKGAGDYGAITPTGIVAHRQPTQIGCSRIQPVITGGGAVFVQTHRDSVYAAGYDLSSDGYRTSQISILSQHLFEGRQIEYLAFQQKPDKLLWFVLNDGTAACCTYDTEQQMVGWSRHVTDGRFGSIAVIPYGDYDELWAVNYRNGYWQIERMARRRDENCFSDAGRPYESCLATLRVNYADGVTLHKQKFLARCLFYTYKSRAAKMSPVGDRARWHHVEFKYSETMEASDAQMDNGFREDAGVEIWLDTEDSFTLLAISPTLTPGA